MFLGNRWEYIGNNEMIKIKTKINVWEEPVIYI